MTKRGLIMRKTERFATSDRVIATVLAIALVLVCAAVLVGSPNAHAVAVLGSDTPTDAVPIEAMAGDSAVATEAIEDKANPLASFETTAANGSWAEWVVAIAVMATAACALVAVRRCRSESRAHDDFENHITDRA